MHHAPEVTIELSPDKQHLSQRDMLLTHIGDDAMED